MRWTSTLLVGASGSYGPLFTFDTTSGKTDALGLPAEIAVYSMARNGEHLYVSGYPSTALARVDLRRPFTIPNSFPGSPGVPWKDARANPHFIGWIGIELGSHHGVAMETGADGRIYICAHRMRYQKGFTMAWYDPGSGKYGELPESSQLDHYQVTWMSRIDGGRKLAISTRVAVDDQKSASAPAEARVFIVDTVNGRFESSFAPLRGEKALGPIAEVAPGVLLGTASDPARYAEGPTTVYKYNLRTRGLEARRLYAGLICGVSSDSDLPRKGADFQLGPDGHVWTVYRMPFVRPPSLIIRINPSTLGLHLVGTVPRQELRFTFVGRDLYMTGETRVRRLRNIVPVVARGE
jgi:hypothetical protein